MTDGAAATTSDDFLNGRLTLRQPARGFRAGVDAVLLAAATPAVAGQSVLELGCGVGTAALCLGWRVPGLALTGVEVQPDYAALARENAAANGQTLEVVTADLRALPPGVRQRRFDHVICNPPYFERSAGTAARDAGRDIALAGDTPLADWIDVAARRLAPRGRLTLIQRIERLPEVLGALTGRIGSVVVRPLMARPGQPPELFLLGAVKDGRAPFRLSAPFLTHDGTRHQHDAESYTPAMREILREGAPLGLDG